MDTIRLEGPLFVADALFDFLGGKLDDKPDFRVAIPAGTRLNDEIGRAFSIASAAWRAFEARREQNPQSSLRRFLGAFFSALGYAVPPDSSAKDASLPFRFPLSAPSLPVFFKWYPSAPSESLDTPERRFSGDGLPERRRSLSQFVQQWLNLRDDALWAVATDGRTLRLFRDNASLTRPAYVEADLARIFSEGRRGDFACLFRLLYRDRAGASGDGRDSVWEKLRAKGAEEGVRVFNDLRDGVVKALLHLGNGFLADPAVRAAVSAGDLSPETFYHELLRTAYRFLFLSAAEERGALHDPAADPAAAKIYDEGYSMRCLADRCRRASARDAHTDLWDGVRIVFRSLASGEPRLALPALGGIFRAAETPRLDAARLSNRALLDAVRALRWISRAGADQRIDYRNMGAEELGSVYESLLELVPSVSVADWRFSFVGIPDPLAPASPARGRRGGAAGNARKLTGSYYTPSSLVDELVRSTLSDAFLDARLKGLKTPAEREAALLSLAVLDPACGSGHFLLAAARRIAERLAQVRSGEDDVVTPDAFRAALRDVVARCVYGADLNPMAVELAKIALWIETLVPGRPLSFLDAHFACGNSVLGISDLDQLRHGIPADAFDEQPGDDPAVAASLKAANKSGLDDLRRNPGAASLFAQPDDALAAQRAAIDAMPGSTLDEIDAKASAWATFRDRLASHQLFVAADYYVAAFLLPKSDPAAEYPVTGRLSGLLQSDPTACPTPEGLAVATRAARDARALHWPLVFPDVFARGGFDCILANPPWDRIKLQEKEFFATRYPAIAAAKNANARKPLINGLRDGGPAERGLYEAYLDALSASVRQSAFVHAKRQKEKGEKDADVPSARYPLTGVGDVNLYALFAELILQILRPEGRAGFIVPTGICTDNSTQAYFNALADARRIESIHDFENRAGLFPAVHRMFKFSLLTLGKADRADLCFFLTDPAQLADDRRHFTLTPDEFALLNPNTRTCPVCRTGRDAELLKKIYRRVGVLRLDSGENPWGVEYKTLFHMSNDSRLFLDAPREDALPLYEAKMVHHFDHRWVTFEEGAPGGGEAEGDEDEAAESDVGQGRRYPTPAEKADPNWEPRPRYWVRRRDVFARLADVPPALFKAAKKWDVDAMRAALANWALLAFPDRELRDPEDTLRDLLGDAFVDLLPANWKARNFDPATRTPILREQLAGAAEDGFFDRFLETRSPQWLMGFRDITNAMNARTVIASIVPQAASGNKLPLLLSENNPRLLACLFADICSIPHDWAARQKVGGTTLNFFLFKQLATLSPSVYTQEDIDFIVPRVLELTYTTYSLKPWAEALGYSGAPFPWGEDRRALLRAELDARYAKLYGLDRDELRYILDPKEATGDPDFPSESFRVLRDDELSRFGEYRTRRLVLEAWREQELASIDTYVRQAAPFVEADVRKDYLKFLIRQMLRETGADTLSISEIFSAWAALSDPRRMVECTGMPIVTKQWAEQFKDAIREDDNLEDTLVRMCSDKQISISKSGMVSLRRFPLDESLAEVRDISLDARLALAYCRYMRSASETMRYKHDFSDAFIKRMEEGEFEYGIAA